MIFSGLTSSIENHQTPKEFERLKSEFLTTQDFADKLLATQGLKADKDFFCYNVRLPKTGGHIHTLEAGRQNKQAVVLIHGYGATSLYWFKVIPHLAQYFRVYSIDQYGTGQSSRPHFYVETFEETVEFFCSAIDEWRKQLKIENFILMGHSFGGYTAARYTLLKNPPIKKLYLLSPAGFTFRTLEEIKKIMKETFNIGAVLFNIFGGVIHLFEDLKFTPFQLMNITHRKAFLEGFHSGERLNMSKKEAKLITEYYYRITELMASGDKALGVFLNNGGRYSKNPLVTDLAKHKDKLPETLVLYGNIDWMDKEHSMEMNEKTGLNLKIQIMENCGHQIIFQQPVEVARIITEGDGRKFKPKEIVDLLDDNYHIK